jgi:hypothetical protein
MAGTKHKSDALVADASKRARSHPASPTSTYLNEEDLNDLSRDELVEHVLELQQQLTAALAAVPQAKEFTPDELKEKSSKARQMVIRGIAKQMKARQTGNLITLICSLKLHSEPHCARRVKRVSSTRATSRMNVSSKRCWACRITTTKICSRYH